MQISKDCCGAIRCAILALVVCAGAFMAFVPSANVASAQSAKPNFKLAYIPCGRINDQSWSQAGYEGVLAAQKELGIEVAYSESVPPADVEAAARDYAAKGFNLVMLHCGTFTDQGLKVAKDFPRFPVVSLFSPITVSSPAVPAPRGQVRCEPRSVEG